jgi:hypothetical protein
MHAYIYASCSIAARPGHGLNSLTLTSAMRAAGPRSNVIRSVDARATDLFLTRFLIHLLLRISVETFLLLYLARLYKLGAISLGEARLSHLAFPKRSALHISYRHSCGAKKQLHVGWISDSEDIFPKPFFLVPHVP